LINQLINFQLANHALASVGLSYQELEILQCTFTPMILGVLGAIWSQKVRPGVTLLVERGGTIAVFAAVAMFVSVSAGSDIGGWARLTFQLAALLLVLAVHFGQTSRVAALLEYRPLRYVGVVSYGVYLLHMFAADFSRRFLSFIDVQNSETFFAATMAFSVLLAGASYRYFERPILALKSKFR
jgi:peptidoglycan/LPS O-acetylase OafA/YrhL